MLPLGAAGGWPQSVIRRAWTAEHSSSPRNWA